MAIVCLILGLMIAVEFNTARFYKSSLVPPKIEELAAQLDRITQEKKAVEQEVKKLNQQLEDIRNSDTIMANLQKDLKAVKMTGGLYPMEGEGISIIISDNPGGFQTGEGNSGSFSDAVDLLMLTNELKSSGAEAISINDQRLTALSEISWTGTMVVVNGNQISQPYRILALGNAGNLETGVSLKGGYLYYLRLRKSVEVKRFDSMELPAYNRSTQMSFGVPANKKQS